MAICLLLCGAFSVLMHTDISVVFLRVYLFDVIVWNNKSDLRLSLSKRIYSHHQKYMLHFAFVWLLCTENVLNQYFTAWKCLQGQHLFSQKCEIINQLFISINVCVLYLFVSLFQEMWPFGLLWNRFRHLWIAKHDTKRFFLKNELLT